MMAGGRRQGDWAASTFESSEQRRGSCYDATFEITILDGEIPDMLPLLRSQYQICQTEILTFCLKCDNSVIYWDTVETCFGSRQLNLTAPLPGMHTAHKYQFK